MKPKLAPFYETLENCLSGPEGINGVHSVHIVHIMYWTDVSVLAHSVTFNLSQLKGKKGI